MRRLHTPAVPPPTQGVVSDSDLFRVLGRSPPCEKLQLQLEAAAQRLHERREKSGHGGAATTCSPTSESSPHPRPHLTCCCSADALSLK